MSETHICSVCRETDQMIQLLCEHWVCRECFFILLRSELPNRCPVCRHNIEVNNGHRNLPSYMVLFSLLNRLKDIGILESEEGKQAVCTYILSLLSNT